MVVLTVYLTIGMILSVAINVAIFRILGRQGVYEIYKSEYPLSKLSPKEVQVYSHFTIVLLFPLLYGVYLFKLAVERLFK